MNKSFKVVFSKARSALMVVNEATSSIQAKGTKTVIAVAAAMVAGGAVAADQATVTIDAGSLTITGAEQNKVEYSASKSGVTTDAKGTVWADADTLADTAKVTFKNNGKLNLTATASGGVTKAVDSLEGTGSLVLTGANGAGAASKDVTLTIGASNAKVALGNSGALTITFANAGTASTDANDNGVATTTVKSNGGDLTLGVVTAAATPGDHNLTKTEGTVTLDAQAGSDGVVSAGTGALTLANVIFQNAGSLTLEGSKISLDSAYEGQTGKLILKNATTATKAVSAKTVYVGSAAKQTTDKVAAEISANDNLVMTGDKAALTVETLNVSDKNLTVEKGASATIGAATIKGTGIVTVGSLGDTVNTAAEIKNLTLSGTVDGNTSGGVTVGTSGSLTGETVTATAGTNLITNGGKIAYTGALTVSNTASASAATSLELAGASGTASFGNISVTGAAVGSAASLTLSSTSQATDKANKKLANVTAGSINVGQYGSVLVSGTSSLHVTGDVNVDALGALETKTGTTTVIDGGLVVAKDASTGTGDKILGGTDTIGYLTNSGTLTNNGTLTITGVEGKDSVNAGSIKGTGSVVIKGGNFTNQKVSGSSADQVVTNFTAASLSVNGGNFVNEGAVNLTAGLTVESGSYTTALTKDGAVSNVAGTAVGTEGITLGKGGVFNVTAYNTKPTDKQGANDPETILTLAQKWTLDGGNLGQIAGKDAAEATVNLASTMDVKGGSVQNFKSLTVDAAGTLNIGNVTDATNTEGTMTLGTLDAKGIVNVNKGLLTVTDANGFKTVADKVTVGEDGQINTTAQAVGLTITDKKLSWGTTPVFNGLKQNDGIVSVTGITGELSTKDTQAVRTKFNGSAGTGLVYLGGLSVTDVNTDLAGANGSVKAETAKALAGIVIDKLATATVAGVAGTSSELHGAYGKLELVDNAAKYTVDAGKVVILTGTGDLISYKDTTANAMKLADLELASGATFVTTGKDAVIGAITNGHTANNGEVSVNGGSLTVKGDIGAKEANKAIHEVVVGDTTAEAGATLTVNGDIFADQVSVKNGSLTMGEYGTTGTMGNIYANTLKVAKTGTLDAGYLVDVSSGQTTDISVIDGTATINQLKTRDTAANGGNGKDSFTVAGTLAVTEFVSGAMAVAAETPFTKANGYLMNIADAAKASVGTNGGKIFVHDGAVVAVGQTSTVADAEAAFAATGFALGSFTDDQGKEVAANKDKKLVKSVIYVGNEDAAAAAKAVAAPTYTSVKGVNGAAVAVNADQMLIIDAAKADVTGKTAVFGAAITLDPDSEVAIANMSVHDKLTIGTFEGQSETYFQESLKDAAYAGDLLTAMDYTVQDTNAGTPGVVELRMLNEKDEGYSDLASTAGFGVAYAMFDQNMENGTSSSAKFNKWLYTSTSWADANGNVAVNQLQTAAKDVASLGATTGVQTMTMDAVNQMGETVADRVSLLTQRAAGVNVWAAANGGMFEAKSLFDGAGYESDIYSGVLGVDYQFACNAVLGAALTIGTADTDNKNSTVKASTDSDLVGFSVYTSKTFADVIGVSADIGYLTASNDVTANGYGQAWKFSQDTDAFTIGLRTEVLAEVGAVKLVPHIGIRYTALSTDGFEAGYKTEIDDQNVFQMPVGVTVSGDFQTGDWTVAPKFDLSVVPTFGDKDADLKLGITGVNATDDLAVRVIDSNPVQATLGVNATNGAWGFGLNYKLGVGSDDRMNNTFNVNVRYAF